MNEPTVGERRATALIRHALFGDSAAESGPDSTWTVEEWDGASWRRIGQAKADQERDRLLHPEQP